MLDLKDVRPSMADFIFRRAAFSVSGESIECKQIRQKQYLFIKQPLRESHKPIFHFTLLWVHLDCDLDSLNLVQQNGKNMNQTWV